MRVLVQRVSSARVTIRREATDEVGREATGEIGREVTGEIGRGLLVFVGFSPTDDDEVLEWMASKCVALRIFSDSQGKMNRSVLDEGGGVLVVSQFTLYADAARGNRPSFVAAAPPNVAERLYDRFCDRLRACSPLVRTGRFGADMRVELVNDGPVTIGLEREAAPRTSSVRGG